MPVFIHADMTENVEKSVTGKLSGSAGPGGMNSEALQGWLLRFRDRRKKLCVSVESFVD